MATLMPRRSQCSLCKHDQCWIYYKQQHTNKLCCIKSVALILIVKHIVSCVSIMRSYFELMLQCFICRDRNKKQTLPTSHHLWSEKFIALETHSQTAHISPAPTITQLCQKEKKKHIQVDKNKHRRFVNVIQYTRFRRQYACQELLCSANLI